MASSSPPPHHEEDNHQDRLDEDFKSLIRGIARSQWGSEEEAGGRVVKDDGDLDTGARTGKKSNKDAFREWKARQQSPLNPVESSNKSLLEEIKTNLRRENRGGGAAPSLRYFEAEDDSKHLRKWEKDVNKMISMVDMTMSEEGIATMMASVREEETGAAEESPDDVPSTDDDDDLSTDHGEEHYDDDDDDEEEEDYKRSPPARVHVTDEMLHRVLSSRPPTVPDRSAVREAVANNDLRRRLPHPSIARDRLRDTWRATYVIVAIGTAVIVYYIYCVFD